MPIPKIMYTSSTTSSAKLSVIVAVYNTAAFIDRCVHSLMRQTLTDIEYIFVDDASTDNSMLIAQEAFSQYPQRKSQIKIIRHTTKLGLAATRQDGLDNATGEYVIHCDPDDWVDLTYYADLYCEAKASKADMVIGDYIEEHQNRNTIGHMPSPKDWQEFYSYPYWIFMSLCFHMIRRKLIIDNGLSFYKGINYAEDNGMIYRCYYYSKHNSHNTKESYYHYNKQNPLSETTLRYEPRRLLDKAKCYELLSIFTESLGKNFRQNVTLFQEMRAIKEGFLLCSPPHYILWHKYFREVTPTVIKDKNLNPAYRIFWTLGQYIHPFFIRFFVSLHSKKQRKK